MHPLLSHHLWPRLLAQLMVLLLIGACLLCLAGATEQSTLLAFSAPAQEDAGAKIDPDLLETLRSAGQADYFVWMREQADLSAAAQFKTKEEKGAFVYNTLRATAERSQQSLRVALDALGLRYQSFYIANKLFVYAGTERAALAIASRPDVAKITPNRQYQLPKPQVNPKPPRGVTAVEPNLVFMRADQVWAMGIDGAGIVLAGNDTGLQWDHPAIIDHYRGWNGVAVNHNYSWWDATGAYPNAPADGGLHGTHTTGTMVGSDGGANKIGVAPGAKTIHCKNMTNDGIGSDLTFSICFQWDLAPWDLSGNNPRPDLAPDAVNNSWGYWGGGYSSFEDEIDALQAAGIIVEVSAGNEGPFCGSLRSPADYIQVLTTGAVNHAGSSLPGTISAFSGRGPSRLDGAGLFPDVMAPGENIRSSIPNDGYEGGWSGTSMAGPHVTGLIGLMWSANPGLRGLVEQTYDLVKQTAVPLAGQTASNCGGDYTTGPNNDWGYGAIDAYAAVDAALTFGATGTLTGTVTNSATGQPIADARVVMVGNNWNFTAYTTAAGIYTRRLPAGVYTVSVSRYGFLPTTVADVSIAEDSVTTRNHALAPAPFYRVTGRVTDKNTGWPLYASVDIGGYPGAPVWTDPVTGNYQVELAGGIGFSFQVNAAADGYMVATRAVGPLTANRVVDVNLDADTLHCAAPGYVNSAHEIFARDFEMPLDGFQFSSASSWERGVPTTGPGVAHSGFNVWATNLGGNYNDAEEGYLTSPAIDLSGYSGRNVRLRWWEWLQTEGCCDVAAVEATPDGGATWNRLYAGRGDAALQWTERAVWLDSSYADANFRFRFRFASDYSIVYPGWYIDDATLSDVTCRAPRSGGLVVGNVVDDITGAGLDGAVIQNMDVRATTATADGPAGAGFYTLHSPAGVKALRATFPGYTPESAMVTVAANSTVRHDYALKSGRPVVTPGALNVALEMGQTATVPLLVENQGTGSFSYALRELPAGFDPARTGGSLALGNPLFAVDAQATTGHQNLYGLEWAAGSWWVTSAGETSYADPNYLFQLDKDGAVLNRWEQASSSEAGWGDLAYDGEYLYAADVSGVVQIDPQTGASTGITLPCPLAFCRALAYDPAADHFWTADGMSKIVEFGRDGEVIDRFENDLIVLGAAWDAWAPGGPYLWVWSLDQLAHPTASQIDPRTGEPTGVSFSGTVLPGSYNIAGGATIVVHHPDFAGQVVLAGLHQATADLIVGYDLDAPASSEVAWLSPHPATGTVAANASQIVQVTFDAGVDGGNQPGEQRALLILANDSPTGNRVVPVQMTVTAPATAGKVQGVVTSLGVCDLTPTPLAGVDVTLRSASGITLTTRTNGVGNFGGWIDAADGPYTVIVTHPKHLSSQATGILVSAGGVATANVNMRLLAPCISPDPIAVTTTVAFGDKAGATLALRNIGAAAGAFDVTEYSQGFQSVTGAQRAALHGTGKVHVADEPKPAVPPTTTPSVLRNDGGPDEFGYIFADSNAVNGPAYKWIEIAPPAGGDGTELTALDNIDDGYFYPLDLPFAFNFYGVDYDKIAVASNGALYFEDRYFSLVNLPIPSPLNSVITFIAPFWDDLVVYPGSIYYKDLGDRFIIEYYEMSGCCITLEPGTWQVILFANGNILFQYKDVVFGGVYDQGNIATVGIQGDGDTGLQYSYDAPSLTDDLAVCFAYPGAAPNCVIDVPWMMVTPTDGAIAADGQTTVALAFDAGVAEVTQPGNYLAQLTFTTQGYTRTAHAAITLQVQPPASWGNVHGVVRSLGACDANPTPLYEAVVTIEGASGFTRTLQTDADGGYALWMDAVYGPFTVTAATPNHAPQVAANVGVPAGSGVQRDFDLRRLQSCITTTATALTVTLTPGASATQVLALRNTGPVAGHFVLRESDSLLTPTTLTDALVNAAASVRFDQPLFQIDKAYVQQRTTQGLALPARQPARLLDAGAILRTWPPTANGSPWGIVYTADGTVWVGEGWGANHMDEYQVDGEVIGSAHVYSWNPLYGPADFTYNANTGTIWVMGVAEWGCIHEVDPNTGVTGVQICPPWSTSQRGLAFDPHTDTYFAGNWNDGRLYRFDASGAILETIASNLAIAGLAYNSATGHLFVMENFAPNLVYVLDVADQYRILGSIRIRGFSAFGGAGLEIDCNGALWAVDQISRMVYQVESGERASWCYSDIPWMAQTPAAGTIAPDGEQMITVEFVTSALSVGDHHGVLRVVHDSPGVRAIDIPVLLQVALPAARFAQQDYSAALTDGHATIDVRLSAPSAQPVTVEYATGDDVRVARSVGKLTFAPGETRRSFTLALLENAPSGVVPLTLRNPVNAILGTPATAFLTLLGDDLRGFNHELWASPQAPHIGAPTTVGAIVHRLKGEQARDVVVRFYLDAPGSRGLLLGDGMVAALGGNGSGASSTVAWTPPAAGVYDLFAVIDPDNQVAESNETNNVLHRLITVLEPNGDAQPPAVTAFAIAGGANLTANRAVSLTVEAVDDGNPATGVTHLYLVEYQLDQALGTWMPVQNSPGWLPFGAEGATPLAAGVTFDWLLSPTPGLKFLQLWAADAIGNISNAPRLAAINYAPESMTVAGGAALIQRFGLGAGDRIRVRLEPASGDPDLYLWAPDALTLPRPPWFSNLDGGATDAVNVVAPVAGLFQVEIFGHEESALRLVVEIVPVAAAAADIQPAGVDPSKPVRVAPLVAPTVNPVDAYGLNPPGATGRPHLYLPLLERS